MAVGRKWMIDAAAGGVAIVWDNGVARNDWIGKYVATSSLARTEEYLAEDFKKTEASSVAAISVYPTNRRIRG